MKKIINFAQQLCTATLLRHYLVALSFIGSLLLPACQKNDIVPLSVPTENVAIVTENQLQNIDLAKLQIDMRHIKDRHIGKPNTRGDVPQGAGEWFELSDLPSPAITYFNWFNFLLRDAIDEYSNPGNQSNRIKRVKYELQSNGSRLKVKLEMQNNVGWKTNGYDKTKYITFILSNSGQGMNPPWDYIITAFPADSY